MIDKPLYRVVIVFTVLLCISARAGDSPAEPKHPLWDRCPLHHPAGASVSIARILKMSAPDRARQRVGAVRQRYQAHVADHRAVAQHAEFKTPRLLSQKLQIKHRSSSMKKTSLRLFPRCASLVFSGVHFRSLLLGADYLPDCALIIGLKILLRYSGFCVSSPCKGNQL